MRSRYRGTGLAILAVLIPCVLSPQAAAADPSEPACHVAKLPLPGPSDYSSVTASDASGRWMVGSSGRDIDGHPHTIVWHNGKGTQPDLPYVQSAPGGVNRHGMVAGVGVVQMGDPAVGFVYTPKKLVELARPAGMDSFAITGISDAGLVTGWAMAADPSIAHAYVWSLDDPTNPIQLKVPAGSAQSFGISPDGHIAVQLTTPDGRYRSFIFTQRLHRTELRVPDDGYQAAVGTIANGWAAGFEQSDDGSPDHARPVRWNLNTHQVQVIPIDFAYFLPTPAVNEDGLLGGVRIAHGAEQAVLYDGDLTRLPMLDDDHVAQINVVTRDGDAAGSSAQDEFSGPEVAVRWTCP